MKNVICRIRSLPGWWLGALLLLGVGCATKPTKQVHIFFPPVPDEPRIQYLTSFGLERDLGGQGKFAEFVLGPSQMIERPIWKPYGVTTTKGKVYVCDTQANSVVIVDLIKRTLRYLKPTGEAAMALPLCVAVDDDGTKYVTDGKRNQIMIYDHENRFVEAFGKKDEFRPCGIAVAGDRLYVTDLMHGCVRVYRKATRELLFTVPRDPADEKAKLKSPTNIAVDQQGRMYVADTGGFAYQVFDAEGKHLSGYGDLGAQPGRFALPKGIGVDHEARIYVVDAAAAVVQLFDKDARLLMYFGEPKSSGDAGLYLPAGLTIDYQNVDFFQQYVAPGHKIEYLIFVTNQAGPHKVGVYGFLRKG